MSRTLNNKRSTYRASGKENFHCQWCFNAKQPEHVVKSHNIRNAAGIVVCQLLLKHQCSVCKEYGHARSKCPVLKEETRERKREDYLKRKRNFQIRDEALLSEKKKQQKSSSNVFAALDSDTESETESDTEFPALKSSNITTRNKGKSVNWASMDSDSEDED